MDQQAIDERILELCADIDRLDEYISDRKFGVKGTLAMMNFRRLLESTLDTLQIKGGEYELQGQESRADGV